MKLFFGDLYRHQNLSSLNLTIEKTTNLIYLLKMNAGIWTKQKCWFSTNFFPFSRTAGTDKSPQHFLTVVGKSRYCRYLNVNHISDKVQIKVKVKLT